MGDAVVSLFHWRHRPETRREDPEPPADDGDVSALLGELEGFRRALHADFNPELLDGEFTVKTFKMEGGRAFLMPANPAYQPIEVKQ